MLVIRDLVKTFLQTAGREPVRAVQGVSFEAEPGSFFTLLGPSGCGKSTIMRCLAGLERPDAGEIRIDDQVVYSSQQNHEVGAASRPIAMVFQSYAIWPHMTVFDNAAFPLRHGRQRAPRGEVRPRTTNMLERMGLAAFADSWATQLSGGQQQRLALARALLCDPKVLLLDEPLSNLDAKLRAALRAELKAFQRAFGVTTIYVTHDQAEALALSDQIAVMNNGKIQQIGPPQDIYNRPVTPFVANFIGNANLIRATLIAGGVEVETAFGRVRSTAPVTAGSASSGLLCIRPEHVHLWAAPPSDARANLFPARVMTSDFLGEHRECTVSVHGNMLHAIAPATFEPGAGSAIWVELPPEHTTFLEEGEDASFEAHQAAPFAPLPDIATAMNVAAGVAGAEVAADGR